MIALGQIGSIGRLSWRQLARRGFSLTSALQALLGEQLRLLVATLERRAVDIGYCVPPARVRRTHGTGNPGRPDDNAQDDHGQDAFARFMAASLQPEAHGRVEASAGRAAGGGAAGSWRTYSRGQPFQHIDPAL